MKLMTRTIERVPDWATTYLYYGDESGLDEGDKKLANDFEAKLRAEGLRLVCPIDGTESVFEPHPAFGLACGTIDWTAEVIPKVYEIECRETLSVRVRIEAHSRKEACKKANELMGGGHDGWESLGKRIYRCKEIK